MPGRVRTWLSRKFPRLMGGKNVAKQDTLGRKTLRPGVPSAELAEGDTRARALDPNLPSLLDFSTRLGREATARGSKIRPSSRIIKVEGRKMPLRGYGLDSADATLEISQINHESADGSKYSFEIRPSSTSHVSKIMLNAMGNGYFVSEPVGRHHFAEQLGIFARAISQFQGHFIMKFEGQGKDRKASIYFIDYSKNIEALGTEL